MKKIIKSNSKIIIVSTIFSFSYFSIKIIIKLLNQMISNKNRKIYRLDKYYNILNEWLKLKLYNKCLATSLEKLNINTIAIYGMGEIGKRLVDELEDSNIKVIYAIDNNIKVTYKNIQVYSLDDQLQLVDMIIITVVHDYKDIENKITNKTNIPFMSIEKIIGRS